MCASLRCCGKGPPGPLYAPCQLFSGFGAARRTAVTFKSTGRARKKSGDLYDCMAESVDIAAAVVVAETVNSIRLAIEYRCQEALAAFNGQAST